MKRLIAETRRLMPDVGIQIPPNLADWWGELVAAGATDLGGLSANGDHISPEHPFPSPHQVRKRLQRDGFALTERLCVYPQYIDREWVAQGVLDTIKAKYWSFIPRRGSGRTRAARADPPRPRRPARSQRARDGLALSAEELTAMFAETRAGGDRGDARGGRRAARRAGGRDGHVRRQPQHQRLERLHRRLRVLRLRPGQALARRLRARPRRSSRGASHEARRLRRHRAVHPVGHPSRLDARGLPRLAALGQGRLAPQLHLHAYSPMEIAHMCDISGPAAGRGVRAAARRRPRLDAGHGRRGAARRRARAHLAEQAAGRALGARSSRPRTAPGCARPRR